MGQSDAADAGADTCSQQAEASVSALCQPIQATARIQHGLPIRLQSEADIRAYELIGTLMALGTA